MQNTRLENGRTIWQALWEFKHPDVECFTAQVRKGNNLSWERERVVKNFCLVSGVKPFFFLSPSCYS